MITKTMLDAFNQQIGREFSSAYLYLSMKAYFESHNLAGFSNWMDLQFKEEQGHAMKLFSHVVERGGTVELQQIDKPKNCWESPLQVFEEVLVHEREITASIHALYDLAKSEKDFAAEIFLQWFVAEQVEEEKNVTDVIDNLKRIEARETALLVLDHRLAKRT
jgi:ferritin